jgi:septal ring factor EnvC (AmiA/AmiB activator)
MRSILLGLINGATVKSFLALYERDMEHGPTPAQRVVALLKDMVTQLETEKTNDQELYDELKCWCKTNEKEKTAAVKAAEQKIAELEAEVQERAGRDATLKHKIAQLEKEIKKNMEALATAEKMRRDDQKEFREQQKDMVQAITSMKQALIVLGKQNAGLLQMTPELKSALMSVLHFAGERKRALEIESGKPAAMAFLEMDEASGTSEFVAALNGKHQTNIPEEYASKVLGNFAQQPAGYKSYNNRSGRIFGILGSMLEEFEKKLADARAEEEKAETEFLQLEKAKKAEIEGGEKLREEKKSEAATNGKALIDAKEDLHETREVYSADKKFLRNLALQCQNIDNDFENRRKTRSDEIAAIQDALKILIDDDNREQLQKTTFLQMRTGAQIRKAAIHVLTSADLGSWENIWHGRNAIAQNPKAQLSTLAIKVSLDSFEKVKEAMDKMVAELKKAQEEDNKHKDYCNQELTTNKQNLRDTNYAREDLETKIEGLNNQIETLTKEIADAQAEIARTEVEIKHSSEDREKENHEFQTEITNQRATQQILAKVLARLNVFYKKDQEQPEEGPDGPTDAPQFNLLQEHQQPPKSFGGYKQNAGSSGVLALIQKIVDDSKKSEAEAVQAEKDAQIGYEQFVSDSNANIKNLTDQVTSKTETMAQANEDKNSAETDHQFNLSELEKLSQYRADLHKECDFLLKNFELRRDARTQEREAVAEAKAILSGAK